MNNNNIYNHLSSFIKQLLNNNYRAVPLYDFNKHPGGWNDYLNLSENKQNVINRIKSHPNITGVAILSGYPMYNDPKSAINVIDVDVYGPTSQEVVNKIRQFGVENNIRFYEETSVSGGHHFCWISSLVYHPPSKIQFYTDDCRIDKDGNRKPHEIAFHHERVFVIAPSYAHSKLDEDGNLASASGKKPLIGQYTKIPESPDIFNMPRISVQDTSLLESYIEWFCDTMNIGALGEKKSVKGSAGGSNSWRHEYTSNDELLFKQRLKDVRDKLHVSVEYLEKRLKQTMSFEDAFRLLSLDANGVGYMGPDEIRFFSLAASDGTHTGAQFYRGVRKIKDKYLVADQHVSYLGGGIRYVAWYGTKEAWSKVFSYCRKICNLNERIKISPGRAGTRQKKFTINEYIDDDTREDIYGAIVDTVKQLPHKADVCLQSPPGSGKTTMFCLLAIEKKDKFIIALPYKSQVDQLKGYYENIPYFQGLCSGDNAINPGATSIFSTYDKLELFFDTRTNGGHNLKDFILIIDEAHNVIEQRGIRKKVLDNMIRHISTGVRATIRLTATPYPMDFTKIDLYIHVKKLGDFTKTYYRYECGEGVLKKAVSHMIGNHEPNEVTVMLHNKIKDLYKIRDGIKQCYPEIEVHVLDSTVRELNHLEDTYNDMKLLRSITKHSRLKNFAEGLFMNGGILLTTTLIVDGVNVIDDNIGNVYTVKVGNPTDYIQFINRFRSGCRAINVFCSGNKRAGEDYGSTQEEYLSYLLNEAERQKTFVPFMTKREYKLKLSSLPWFVDNATQQAEDDAILHYLSIIENSRMAADSEYFRDAFENSDFEYNVSIHKFDYALGSSITGELILASGGTEAETRESLSLKELKSISGADKWTTTLNMFCRIYGSKYDSNQKFRYFQEQIRKAANKIKNNSSNVYCPPVTMIRDMHNQLLKVCVGLILRTDRLSDFILSDYSNDKLKSILNTYHNLMIIKKHPQAISKNETLLRLIKIKKFIQQYILLPTIAKEDNWPILYRETLSDLKKHLRNKYTIPYSPEVSDSKTAIVKDIRKDLDMILDFETKHFSGNKVYYLIKEFHTLDNCHGWETNKVRNIFTNMKNIFIDDLTIKTKGDKQ